MLKRIRRTTKDTMSATSASSGSMQTVSTSITRSQKEVMELKQIEWETLGQPILRVTDLRAVPGQIIAVPNWMLKSEVRLVPGDTSCRVCGATNVHEDKCTNQEQELEAFV